MNHNGPYYLLLESQKDPAAWTDAFSPYTILWNEGVSPLEGKIFLQENGIGEVRYFPEELRLEIFPFTTFQTQLEGLLAVPAFKELCTSPITRWIEKQIATLTHYASHLEDMEALLAYREALCKLYSVYQLFIKAIPKDKRKALKRLLKKRLKHTNQVRDNRVLSALLEERGLTEEKIRLKGKKALSALQHNESSFLVSDIQKILEQNRFALSGYHPRILVAKAHRRLVKAVHTVHSARDVKAMHKVLRRVKSLMAVSEMAGVKQEKPLRSLEEVLGRWHDLILLQDLLLKREKPPIETLRVLVDLEVKIQHLVSEYRHLSSVYWEEMV